MVVVTCLPLPYVDQMAEKLNHRLLPPTRHRYPDPDAGPWVITLEWVEMDGRPECAAVQISREGGEPAPMPGALLRQVPFAEYVASDRAAMAPPVEATGGMRKSAADRLRLAAEVYQKALAEGRKPTKAVAEHFGISQGGASNLVARVRAAGLLPPTSPGKATG